MTIKEEAMFTQQFRAFICMSMLTGAAVADPLLVPPKWLAEHLKDSDLVLLHIGQRDEYDAGHIEGARFVTLRDISIPERDKALSLELPDAAQLRGQLEALGISDKSRVVVYFGKDWVSPATRVIFTLDAAGLGKNVSLLDGGMPAWKRDGNALSKAAAPVARGTLAALTIRPVIVDAAFVQANKGKPGFVLIDGRSPALYDGVQTGGSREEPHKTGHIVGAGTVPFNAITETDLVFKSPDKLAAMFTAAGVKPGDTVIGYCHIGQQATTMLYAARSLGYKTVLYDGSFEDWSRRDLPVENPGPRNRN
jgi:thiosulfate/3-mercaptopyruvate sulfurtransferase